MNAPVAAPVVDYVFDAPARHVIPSSKPPLRESTGHTQQQQHEQPGVPATGPSTALCMPSSLPGSSHSTIQAHIPTLMTTSQAGGPGPASIFGTGLKPRRNTLGSVGSFWRTRNMNPFYDHPQFRQYRHRQEQKEEKEGHKWPPILEDPFLDALLLIPDMGRSKYFMLDSLHGRNMIISRYVWLAYCRSLPPGVPPNEAIHHRDRKAISSHIQVLKAFFKEHRFFHFFFPTKDEEQRRGGKTETRTVESMSLKNNPVLVALASGLFPDVRPNYEYFAHLLSLNSTVAVRPKTCWEFVSSPDISLDEARTLRNRSGNLVDTSQYPQLRKSLQDGGNPQRGPDGSILLHEYTRSISQTFSTTTKEIAKLWEINFPALYENLNLPEPQDEDSLTILEMTTTLELHENHFPSGSELNGLIEMTIALPYLQSHRWKCLTRLARPKELCSDPENDPLVVEHTDEVAMQYTHQPGCSDGATGCDCMSRPRQDIRVPFPAAEWASMLTNCASYPETPSSERRRQAGHDDDSSLRSEVTQKELIAQIGMLQELWSCPPHSGKWTRQAVILWRFQDVHQFSPKKKKWVAEPAGTSWRFLTVNDPTSDYHMRNAYVSATSVNGSADTGGIASTGDHGSYNANDFPTWAEVGFPENQLRALGPAPPTGLDFGSFYHGLTTPPPTATLSSPYASSLEPSHDLNQSHQLSFLPTATACSTPVDSQTSSLLGDVPSTDHFLSASTAAVDVSGGAMGVGSYEEESDPTLHHWDGPVSALDAWTPSQYGVDASLTAAEKAAADWDGSTTRDWDKSWSPTGMSSMRAWDDGRGVVPGVVSVSPSPTLADSVARYSPRIKYSHAETGKIGSPTPPLKGNMQGVKRERTNSLDFEYEERKMRRVDGPGMREGGILGGHPTFGIAAGHEGTW